MPEIRSLQDITEARWQKLKQDIKKAKGRVIVLVHPFGLRGNKSYLRAVNGLLKKSNVPIVILEEYEIIPRTIKKLRSLKVQRHLILPTEETDPLLLTHYRNGKPVFSTSYRKIARILKSAGARKVFVGGQETHSGVDPVVRSHEKRTYLRIKELSYPVSGGCAGGIYANLIHSKKFNAVKLIPEGVYPMRPRYLLPRRRPH